MNMPDMFVAKISKTNGNVANRRLTGNISVHASPMAILQGDGGANGVQQATGAAP